MAVSEFLQLDHVHNLATSPEDYLAIVRGKTAGPFAAGCHAAGLTAGLPHDQALGLERFGMELGIAFQLVDDLLDLLGRIGLTAAKNEPAGGNADNDHQQASTTKNKQFLDKSTACLWFCIIFSHLSFPS